MSGRPCGKTRSGLLSMLLFHCHGNAGRCQHALVHGQGLAHDGKGVHGVELGRVGLGDEVAGGVRFDLLDTGHAGRDAGVARAGQHGAG
jgi:hypothetical protein